MTWVGTTKQLYLMVGGWFCKQSSLGPPKSAQVAVVSLPARPAPGVHPPAFHLQRHNIKDYGSFTTSRSTLNPPSGYSKATSTALHLAQQQGCSGKPSLSKALGPTKQLKESMDAWLWKEISPDAVDLPSVYTSYQQTKKKGKMHHASQ